MVYLIDPINGNRPPCKTKCTTLCDLVGCTTYCGIKPLYGIDPPVE